MTRIWRDARGVWLGLPRSFARKIFRQDRKAENRCGSHAPDDRPDHVGGHRQAQNVRKLRRNEQHAHCRQHDLRANAMAAQALSQDAEQESSDTQCESHYEKIRVQPNRVWSETQRAGS